MLNNKGQSLVLFIIVLPILLLTLILVVDIGKTMILRHELNNISNIVLDYGLDNLGKDNLDDELVNLVKLNNNNIDKVDIRIEENMIYINMWEVSKGMFSSLIDISVFEVNTSYVGYIENNEKRIERMGD